MPIRLERPTMKSLHISLQLKLPFVIAYLLGREPSESPTMAAAVTRGTASPASPGTV